ncbi:hypothetical protein R1flu_021617 [Riccia fluitans]|uniref:Polynucleotide 5'-hydroxyl-kinase NOL9 n=1 Tax=Riccia fluitans TaxID=41844 RepID=A0ABD1ZPX2_9MARC
MKGLLSGMSLPTLLSKSPKRHLKPTSGGSRKKLRKSSELCVKGQVAAGNIAGEPSNSVFVEHVRQESHEDEENEANFIEPQDEEEKEHFVEPQENHIETPESLGAVRAEEPEPAPETPRCITWNGNTAIVRLSVKQTVVMDGWAIVSLLQGRASVHGYSLSPGVAVLLCSNSKYSAAVHIEAVSSIQSSGFSSELDLNVSCCILEFKSYRGTESDSAFEVQNHEHEATEKRTFRLEIPGEFIVRDVFADHLINKRKRQELAGQRFEVIDEKRDVENLSDQGEDSADGSKERENVEEFDDMDVDEQQEDSEGCSDDDRPRKAQRLSQTPLQPIVIPENWKAAASSISSCFELSGGAPVVAVCGAKGSGKSTFGRFLLNHLLTRYESVGYLDTDVGQPEFTVPGCLSFHILTKPVFGSPILHLQNPERSFFYGDITPKSDPGMYCRIVEDLYDYFQQNYGARKVARVLGDTRPGPSQMPLIVNTHGWLKGVGYDALISILRHTSPTHLVHINSVGVNNNLPTGKFWRSSAEADSTALLYIENVLEGPEKPLTFPRASATQQRNARILAYFRQCFWKSPLPYPYREDKLYAQTAAKLVSCRPYQIPISAVDICHLHCQVPESEKLHSINGALVGLGVSWKAGVKYSGGSILTCVGIGLVRGVDLEKGLLYVLTPLDMEILQDVDTLMQGWMEVPLPLLLARGYVSPYLCHNSVAIEGTGSVAIKRAHEKFAKTPRRTA